MQAVNSIQQGENHAHICSDAELERLFDEHLEAFDLVCTLKVGQAFMADQQWHDDSSLKNLNFCGNIEISKQQQKLPICEHHRELAAKENVTDPSTIASSTRPILDNRIVVLNATQAADLLNVSTKSLYKLVRDEVIPYRRVGKVFRFLRSELIDWLKGA